MFSVLIKTYKLGNEKIAPVLHLVKYHIVSLEVIISEFSRHFFSVLSKSAFDKYK